MAVPKEQPATGCWSPMHSGQRAMVPSCDVAERIMENKIDKRIREISLVTCRARLYKVVFGNKLLVCRCFGFARAEEIGVLS